MAVAELDADVDGEGVDVDHGKIDGTTPSLRKRLLVP